MPTDLRGAIDCDVHARVPSMQALTRFMDDYWRETVELRGIEPFETISYPPNSPLTLKPGSKVNGQRADESVELLKSLHLDRLGLGRAIVHCTYGVQVIRDDYMAVAFARAVNDWLAADWLDRDPRLRAALVVPVQVPELAVEEIERRAADRRFVSVLLLAMGEHTLGRRMYWPIYAAAERHGFAITMHAGSSYHHAVTGSGWPSYHLEDAVAQSNGFHTQLGSLISEGVFVKFPRLKVVLTESGVTWLPPYLWRLSKFWRGVRNEVPWVDRDPIDYVRDHVRLTLQPFDGPADPGRIARVIDQLGSDELLLFSTDFPHAQYDGDDPVPAGLPPALVRKMLVDNPLATYPRLGRPA